MTVPAVIEEAALSQLPAIGTIPIAFTVTSTWLVTAGAVSEQPVPHPYVKDYDSLPNNNPASWLTRFDTRHWGLLTARVDGQLVGAAVIAGRMSGLSVQEGRADVAILWDLRVAPAHRGHGIGAALFSASERWAVKRGCTELRVETQNTNAAACRLYRRHGCELLAVNHHAYADLPDEVQLIWGKALKAAA